MSPVIRMSGNDFVILAMIVVATLIIYVPWHFDIKIKGLCLMGWMLIGLYFLAPVVSLILIGREKERR